MTLIRRATFAVPNMVNWAVAVLFPVIAELQMIKITFIVNKDKGKSFDQVTTLLWGLC